MLNIKREGERERERDRETLGSDKNEKNQMQNV